MRPLRSSIGAAALLATASTVFAGVGFDCKQVVANRVTWDLSPLGGPHSVHWVKETPPTVENTTFTINICKGLGRDKEEHKDNQCDHGTRICGITRLGNTTEVTKVRPIAGDYQQSHGKPLESIPRRLKDSDSNSESEKEGVSVELSGGTYGGNPQKAIIEFVCNPEKTGLEGMEEDKEDVENEDEDKRRRRAEDDGEEQPEDPDKGHALQFISYKDDVQIKGKTWGVLRLQWETKYACENARDEARSGSWGFFTWFIIVYVFPASQTSLFLLKSGIDYSRRLFLGVSAYLIFGSWMNYSRYGARGWDLLPHGDTIRDIPYILKDWGRRVVNTVQGPGSRGGYSAVSLR
jgi:autophagy-related protein 27